MCSARTGDCAPYGSQRERGGEREAAHYTINVVMFQFRCPAAFSEGEGPAR